MTETYDKPTDEMIQHWKELSLAEEFANATLEYIFTQSSTPQEINQEIKRMMKFKSKEQIFMFWFKIKNHLQRRLKILINSVPPYGLGKMPEDLLKDFHKDIPEATFNRDDLFEGYFQNMSENEIRSEIEKLIEEDRYEDLMMIQDKIMFRVCAMCNALPNVKPSFSGNPKGLEYNLAFFNLLMEYQNKMSGGEELETEVIIKKKGT